MNSETKPETPDEKDFDFDNLSEVEASQSEETPAPKEPEDSSELPDTQNDNLEETSGHLTGDLSPEDEDEHEAAGQAENSKPDVDSAPSEDAESSESQALNAGNVNGDATAVTADRGNSNGNASGFNNRTDPTEKIEKLDFSLSTAEQSADNGTGSPEEIKAEVSYSVHLDENGLMPVVCENGNQFIKLFFMGKKGDGGRFLTRSSYPVYIEKTSQLNLLSDKPVFKLEGNDTAWALNSTNTTKSNVQSIAGYVYSDQCTIASYASLFYALTEIAETKQQPEFLTAGIHLYVSMPISEYMKSGKAEPNLPNIDRYIKQLARKVTMNCDGKDSTLNIEKVTVLPEGIMAALQLTDDLKNSTDSVNELGEFVVCDFGGAQLDVTSLTSDMGYLPQASTSIQLGSLRLRHEISSLICSQLEIPSNSISDSKLDTIIRTKKVRYKNEEHDFTDLVNQLLRPLAKEAVHAVKEATQHLHLVSKVVFVGGTASLCWDLLKEEVEDVFGTGVFLDITESLEESNSEFLASEMLRFITARGITKVVQNPHKYGRLGVSRVLTKQD